MEVNIFVLDISPILAAQYQCNKHVVKMCLETAQMLSTIAGGPYKPTHANHPCTIWARATTSNFDWLCAHGISLCNEYEYRFGKIHKCKDVIKKAGYMTDVSHIVPSGYQTPFAQAMPEELKNKDAVKAYRDYYIQKSKTIDMQWTKRDIPSWFIFAEKG